MSPGIRITVTVPKEILKIESVISEIRSVMDVKTSSEIKALFQLTVGGWSESRDRWSRFGKVNFLVSKHFGPRINRVTVYTNSKKYALVNGGASAHPISAGSRRGLLRFQDGRGYIPSTTPRLLSSAANYNFGSWVRVPMVQHPGFKAREFDEEIAETYTPTFEGDIQAAINRGSE